MSPDNSLQRPLDEPEYVWMGVASKYYVFDRHHRYGLSSWEAPSDPDDEESPFAQVSYDIWEEAALDVGANVAGSVHGTLEIYASPRPSEDTLVARCHYSSDGPVWEAGPLGVDRDGVVFPANS